jgi:2-polyprenyl-6-methoxyphenol hydroxylase-like FAD-dependent oxidoreductase
MARTTPMLSVRPVAVVGAGPTCLALANQLATENVDFVVLDRLPPPREHVACCRRARADPRGSGAIRHLATINRTRRVRK